MSDLTKSAQDVLAERERQKEVEGCTPEHDDTHVSGEMAVAAGCYALFPRAGVNPDGLPPHWPWDADWWKPKDRRSDLVRGAALLLAEIERLDRAEEPRDD